MGFRPNKPNERSFKKPPLIQRRDGRTLSCLLPLLDTICLCCALPYRSTKYHSQCSLCPTSSFLRARVHTLKLFRVWVNLRTEFFCHTDNLLTRSTWPCHFDACISQEFWHNQQFGSVRPLGSPIVSFVVWVA